MKPVSLEAILNTLLLNGGWNDFSSPLRKRFLARITLSAILLYYHGSKKWCSVQTSNMENAAVPKRAVNQYGEWKLYTMITKWFKKSAWIKCKK